MLTNYPEDKWEWEEAKRIAAPDWMLEALRMNPHYTGWAPGCDYMRDKGTSGWSSALYYDDWDSGHFGIDDLNIVSDFYFRVTETEYKDRKDRGNTTPARLELLFWALHPRKGASRGVVYRSVREKDLPNIFAYLAEAHKQNTERFARVLEEVKPATERLGEVAK